MKVKELKPQVKLILYIILAILMIGTGLYFQNSKSKNIKYSNENEVKRNEVNNQEVPYENIFPSLRELYNNNDIKAELSIPSINLKELVLQTNDNDFYLEHDIYKNKNYNGAIFIDYRTSDIDTAKQLNIYGHNSLNSDLPFKALEQYLQKDFFLNNLFIDLKTEKRAYSYKIFAVSAIDKSDNEHMIISREKEEFLNHVALLRSKALYDTKENVSENAHILIIQTCLYEPERFLLVMAKRI